MKLVSTAPGFLNAGLTLPPVTIDTSGDFDTGRLALPSWSSDGIALAPPDDPDPEENFIRLARTGGRHLPVTRPRGRRAFRRAAYRPPPPATLG